MHENELKNLVYAVNLFLVLNPNTQSKNVY